MKKSFSKSDLLMVVLDIVSVNLAFYLALILRNTITDMGTGLETAGRIVYFATFYRFAPIYTILCIIVFYLFKLYGGLWKYAGVNDLGRILKATGVTFLIQIIGTILFMSEMPDDRSHMPMTYYGLGILFQFLFTFATRFSYRIAGFFKRESKKTENAMIIGAGELGRQTAQALKEGSTFNITCVIDTENEYVGKIMDGVPIFGIDALENALDSITCVFLAEPDLSESDKRRIEKACEGRGIEVRARENKRGPVLESEFTPIQHMDSDLIVGDEDVLSQEDAWKMSILSGGKY